MEGFLNFFIDVLKFGLPYSVLALGIFISYRILDFADLGAEGSYTLGGAVVAICLYHSLNPFLSLLISIVCGFLAGIITGVLHTKLRIPKLLSGIITMTALFSINMFIMGFGSKGNTSGYASNVYLNGKNTNGVVIKTIYDTFLGFFSAKNYNIIFINILLVVLVLAIIYFFFGTEIGMSVRSTGMNEAMSRAQGINTSLMIILGLGISNALIAMSGALYTQVNRTANNTMGVGVLVIGLASIIIGEAIFGKRSFKNWILSVTFGAVIYYLVICLVLKLGLPDYCKKLLYALLITIVLVIPLVKKAISKNKSKRKGDLLGN